MFSKLEQVFNYYPPPPSRKPFCDQDEPICQKFLHSSGFSVVFVKNQKAKADVFEAVAFVHCPFVTEIK